MSSNSMLKKIYTGMDANLSVYDELVDLSAAKFAQVLDPRTGNNSIADR